MANKRLSYCLVALTAGLCSAQNSLPSTYNIQTIAGSASPGDGGPASAAVLRSASAVAFDAQGNMYIADGGNASIRKIAPDGTITTLAGTGQSGYGGDGGPATQAQLGFLIMGLAFDADGNLYVSDTFNNCVRRITPDGTIEMWLDGYATPGRLWMWPLGLAFDSAGNLYIADGNNGQILQLTPEGVGSVFAGIGFNSESGDGGPATAAALNDPVGLLFDASGNLYVTESLGNRIRRISPDGTINTVAGTGKAGNGGDGGPALQAQFNGPQSITADSTGNLYIADRYNYRIRMIAPDGAVSTFAGTNYGGGRAGGDGGPATQAVLPEPVDAVALPSGNLYIVTDTSVRVITGGTINTVAGVPHFQGDGGPAMQALFSSPQGLALDTAGNVYVADMLNCRIRKIDSSGMVSTFAGTGGSTVSGDFGLATSASIGMPYSLAVDASGNIYAGFFNRVRRISPNGVINTIAGGGTDLGDGIPATRASLGSIYGIATDSSGNLYIADSGRQLIRKITPDGIIHTIAGNGAAGNSGDGGPAISAKINNPRNLAVDSAGNLYFADMGNYRVRVITPDGTIQAFAGDGFAGFSNNALPAVWTQLWNPFGVATDNSGNVYISDGWFVRVVTPDGNIQIIGGKSDDVTGSPLMGFSGDGSLATVPGMNNPLSIAVDPTGKVYVVEQGNERVRLLTPNP